MNTGKTLFAQLMDFLPWTTFTRIVERHGGNRYVKSLTCTDQFRVTGKAACIAEEIIQRTAQVARRSNSNYNASEFVIH